MDIVMGADRTARAAAGRVQAGWVVLGWAGVALLAVGLAELALTWWPLGFGRAEWEFATVSATLGGMPVPMMGAVLGVVGFGMAGQVLGSRLTGVVALLLVLLVLVCGTFLALTTPLALKATTDPILRIGVKKVILKGAWQFLVYVVFLTWLGIRGFRAPSAAA